MTLDGAPKAYFVTGTDTEIGKTLVSCALLLALAQRGWQTVGMKPVAAGAYLEQGSWLNEDVVALKKASNLTKLAQVDHCINPYLFKLAAAPHIAAQQEHRKIELRPILDCYQELAHQAQAIIVEGVGGFRVPLNDQEDSADLAQQLQLPVIMVVGMRLGCISQGLLTAEAIETRGLKLAGWVANCPQGEMANLHDNIAALRMRLTAPLLGCIPHLDDPDPVNAVQYLEMASMLSSEM